MRKITFLSLCLSVFISFSSCTKEKTNPPIVNPPQEQPPTVVYSEWMEESSLTWSDTLVNAEPNTRAVLNASGLTQSTIDNGAVLIYARTNSDASVRIFPAMILDANNSDYEMYQSFPIAESFELLHSKFVNGVFETPTVSNNISFRYIYLENVPPANGRINTGAATGLNMEDLKAMSYQDVVILLSIPN